MATKTYVLLSHTEATAPIYQRVNANERVRFQKRPFDRPYLQITYAADEIEKDASGKEITVQKNRTIRLKHNSNSIFLDEQIKQGIPANQPPTDAERRSLLFRNGALTTNMEIVQRFLEASPQYNKFKGFCSEISGPLYDLLDESLEIKSKNLDFKQKLKAANKIDGLKDLKEAQDLIIRLNGTYVKPPESLEECQNWLVDFLDEADDAMMTALMSDEVRKDDEVTILITRARIAGIISFDNIPNQIAKKKGNDWTPIKQISSEFSPDERQRHFAEYLATTEGQLLMDDLKKDVEKAEKKSAAKQTA